MTIPSYYDKDGPVECYAEANTVRIIADQVDMTPDQALRFGVAIIECALYHLRNTNIKGDGK